MQRRKHIALIKASMKNAKKSCLKLNVVVIGNSCCEECDKIDNQIFSFEDAEKMPPIPNPLCVRPSGCNCAIGFIPLRDSNEKLITN